MEPLPERYWSMSLVYGLFLFAVISSEGKLISTSGAVSVPFSCWIILTTDGLISLISCSCDNGGATERILLSLTVKYDKNTPPTSATKITKLITKTFLIAGILC